MNKFITFLPWVMLIVLSVSWYMESRKLANEMPSSGAVNSTVPIEKRYTDKEGNEHIVIQDGKNVITKAELKNPERPPNIIDSSAANLKIAKSEIQRVTRINTVTRDSLLKARSIINKLTKRVVAYEYNDKYVRLKYTPPVNYDTLDQGTFDFAYNADLNIVQYQKRKWFLGQKKSFIDISSNDPRTTIRGVKQLTVEQEAPSFGLRLQLGANYNPATSNLGLGPAARVDLGRLSVQANYLYYNRLGRWYPGISANLDLIRF